jgi:nicotinamide-nucleotide amidase
MSEHFSDHLPDNVEEAIKNLLQKACDRESTLATAESCTDGLLATLRSYLQ